MRERMQNPKFFLNECVLPLVEEFDKIDNCHLVLISLIPSLETNKIDGKYFKEVNLGLAKFGTQYSRVSYLNMSHHFVKYGKVIEELYEDGKHLNEDGSAKYALELKKYFMKISNKKFF